MSFRSNDDIKAVVQATVSLGDIDNVSVTAPADRDVLTWDATSSSWAPQAVTAWPSSTGADYAGTPYEQALVAAANGNLILSPSGDGAIIAQVPNGTAAGGNTRGQYATDWQRNRFVANQVAQNSGSTLKGGRNNYINSFYGTVGGGTGNQDPGGSLSVVAGGRGNNANDGYGTISGGRQNITIGDDSTIGGGYRNGATDYSAVVGGAFSNPSHYGEVAHSLGSFSFNPAQHCRMILRCQTTNATTTELSANGGPPGTSPSLRFGLASNTAYKFKIDLVARESATNDTAWWEISGAIRKGSFSLATSLVGSLSTNTGSTAGASTWAVSVTSATTGNGALLISVTGQAGKTIRWVASLHATRITG